MRNDFESNYLAHWGLKKGQQKENHKYVARIELSNGKYRYFYSIAEYKAYVGGKTKKDTPKKKTMKDRISSLLDRSSQVTQETIDKGRTLIDKKFNPSKYVKKDLSTDNARKEKTSVKKNESISKKKAAVSKDLNTISAKEKADVKKKAQKQERINAALERDRARHKKEKEDRAKISSDIAKKKVDSYVKSKEKENESALNKLIQKAKKMFCKDAKDSAKEDYSKHKNIPIKKAELSKDQDMAAVNRGRRFYQEKMLNEMKTVGRDSDEYYKLLDKYNQASNNCASCSLTYDLRRRGYDVTAPKLTNYESEGGGLYSSDLINFYKPRKKLWDTRTGKEERGFITNGTMWAYGMKQESSGGIQTALSSSQIRKIEKEILKNPEGSYGYLNVGWVGGSGHSMIWTVENGEVVVRDAQINEKKTLDDVLDYSSAASYFRADDLELNDSAYEWVMASEVSGNTVITKKKGK